MTKENLEKYVSEDGFDLCVFCRTETEYKSDVNIESRNFYVECAGQLCVNCYVELEKETSVSFHFLKKYLDHYL
jgi:hypothetical protein